MYIDKEFVCGENKKHALEIIPEGVKCSVCGKQFLFAEQHRKNFLEYWSEIPTEW